MKQPELGKKITELRKAKGLTQEELVEKCNISVRTIQRIEAGEVTPRSYTVKTILSALDFDFKDISIQEGNPDSAFVNRARDLMLVDLDTEKPANFLISQLNIAWIAGVLYFVLGFIEGAADYFRFATDDMVFGKPGYIVIKILVLICYVFFMRGFVLIGSMFDNYLLRVICIVAIVADILIASYDVVSVLYDSVERPVVLSGAAMAFGGIGIIFGLALRRLDKPLGRVAELAGIFEIIAACFFVTVVLSFIGLFILIPAELFEIICIFKVIEVVKARSAKLAEA